jgi:hypothetical protein
MPTIGDKGMRLARIAVIASGLCACGADETPGSSGGGGTASGGRVGEAGEPGSGGGGVGGATTCADAYLLHFASCVSPEPMGDGGPQRNLSDLTVVESLPADFALCGLPGFALPTPDGSYLEEASGPFEAWRLEDSSGNSWIVQFAVGPVPDAVLSPGDTVDLLFFRVPVGDLGNRGYIAIEKNGMPAIFFAYGAVPVFSEVPDFAFEPVEPVCMGEAGCGFSSVKVTANGESAVIATDESAEVGGLVVRNDAYFDNTACPNHNIYRRYYMLGGYLAP